MLNKLFTKTQQYEIINEIEQEEIMCVDSNIKNYEEKKLVVNKILEKVHDGDVIGFGSGTTSSLAVEAISKKINRENISIVAVPTSDMIKNICKKLNIKTAELNEVDIDWAFDGADEVDENGNMIKGMGAAMFKEKLNILNSPKVYILVDQSKFVKELGEKHPIPIECYPASINYVEMKLKELGAKSIELRRKNDEIVYTDSNNVILDSWFEKELIKKDLEDSIKLITGVIETGLFIDYKNVQVL